MVETGVGADRLLIAQCQEATPTRWLSLVEVYRRTAGHVATDQLTVK